MSETKPQATVPQPASDTAARLVAAHATAPQQASPAVTLTAPQKAAIIIAMLGPEAAAPITERLQEKHLKSFADAFTTLHQVPRDTLTHIVSEFIDEVRATLGCLKGGAKATQEMLTALFDEDKAKSLVGEAVVEIETTDEKDVWQRISEANPEDFAQWLATQRAQLVAIIVSQLSPEVSSLVVAELPDALSQKVVLRLTQPLSLEENTLVIIGRLVETQFLDANNSGDDGGKAVDMVAQIMNFLPPEKRDALFSFVEDQKPEKAVAIKQNLITFEDLPDRLPRAAVPALFKDLDQDVLLTTLKLGQETAPGTVDYLFSNISQRMAKQFQEQLEERPAANKKDAEAAQTKMMVEIGRMAKEGQITLLAPPPASGAESF